MAMLEHPGVVTLRRQFEAAGFDLAITPIATGRYVACATNEATGQGPIAAGDTPQEAAATAWRRFETYRQYYRTTDPTTPGQAAE
jgi:hypothetical protein